MGTLMAVLATLAFCSCAVVLVVRSTVRAVRRRLLGLREAALLRARSHGVGPAAEVARLRRDMERSLGGARRALAAAQTVRAPVGDVRSLLARLELAARAVDGELRMLESQPDRSRLAAGLAGARVAGRPGHDVRGRPRRRAAARRRAPGRRAVVAARGLRDRGRGAPRVPTAAVRQ